MHTYLESIGFDSIRSGKEMERLIRDVVLHFDDKTIYETDNGRIRGEFFHDYAPDMGIGVFGEFDEGGSFHPEYSFPYFVGSLVSTRQVIDFEKHAGEDAVAGVLDDARVGASLIFELINAGEYQKHKMKKSKLREPLPVKFTFLARDAKIILPVVGGLSDENEKQRRIEARANLLARAKGGDEAAIETLTLEEMNQYNEVTTRIVDEDILSIADSYFMPYGIESDQYSILGSIIDCEKVMNTYTNELVWQLNIEVCDISLEVCVNAEKLLGEPAPGRRFKGLGWLQGYVHF